jgi:ADP-ribose pyrophosphatase YjhB (NUDIX family)
MTGDSYIRKLRAMVGHEKLIIPAAAAILQTPDGQILLQDRADFDVWAFPGGFVEIGENAFEALTREVTEETGLTPLSGTLVGLYSDPRYDVTYPNGDRLQSFLVIFHVAEWTGEIHPLDPETKDVRFFDHAQLPERMAPWAREILGDFRRSQGRVTVK